MIANAKYVHTNLIARDWQKLSEFYRTILGCVPVLPERHYKGVDLERGTGVAGTELHGIHLRLPGYGNEGPTLEIYSYTVEAAGEIPAVNRPGLGHLAFSVPDVADARKQILEAGGTIVGDIVTLRVATGAEVTWCYVCDPEGNIIELQSWSK